MKHNKDYWNYTSFVMAGESGEFYTDGNYLRPISGSGVAEYFGHSRNHNSQSFILPCDLPDSEAIQIGGSRYTLSQLASYLNMNIEEYKKPRLRNLELRNWFRNRSIHFSDILDLFPALELMFSRGKKYKVDATYIKPPAIFKRGDGSTIESNSYIAYTDRTPYGRSTTAFNGSKQRNQHPSASEVPLHLHLSDNVDYIIICDSGKDIPAYLLAGYKSICATWGVGNLPEHHIEHLIKFEKDIILVTDCKDTERKSTHRLGKKIKKIADKFFNDHIIEKPIQVAYFDFDSERQDGFDATDCINENGIDSIKAINENSSITLHYKEDDKKAEKKSNSRKRRVERAFDGFRFNDSGNARRFVKHFGDNCRYVYPWKSWLIWNDKYWEIDQCGKIRIIMNNFFDYMHSLAEKEIIDEDELDHFVRFLEKSENKIDNILKDAAPYLSISVSQLDTHKHLLNCQNGTVNLKTGELQDFDKNNYITKITTVDYKPRSHSPNWEKYLLDLFSEDLDLIFYVQKVIGYSFTSESREKSFYILTGSGNNGKSTFLTILSTVLGSYSHSVGIEAILSSNQDVKNHSFADARETRLVTVSEPGDNDRIHESKIKTFTGLSDPIQVRHLFKEFFTIYPTFKIFLSSNSLPKIKGSTNAIWNRVKVIPFRREFTAQEIADNRDFQDDILSQEMLEVVLNWSIQGSIMYYEKGIQEPEIIKKMVAEYREDSDFVQQFIGDVCEKNENYRVKSSELFHAFKKYCETNEDISDFKIRTSSFKSSLIGKGFRYKKGSDARYFIGLRMREEERHKYV